jgi:hypothetical protein
MGVEITYQRISTSKFQRVTADQEAWQKFRGSGLPGIEIEDVMKMASSPTPESRAKFVAALKQMAQDPTRLEISKDWHVLYYLFNGSAEIAEEHREGYPLHNVIFGGHSTSVATGYGAVRYFDRLLVTEIAAALASLKKSQIYERFVPEEFQRLRIYAAPIEGDREIIVDLFVRMLAFFRQAEEAKEYVIVYGH